MTEEQIKAYVLEILNEEFGAGPRASIVLHGGQSFKGIGEMVGRALLHSPIVVVDGSGVRSVASHKVWWR